MIVILAYLDSKPCEQQQGWRFRIVVVSNQWEPVGAAVRIVNGSDVGPLTVPTESHHKPGVCLDRCRDQAVESVDELFSRCSKQCLSHGSVIQPL